MPRVFLHNVVTFQSTTGLPEDQFVNTWNSFSDILNASDQSAQMSANLFAFYNSGATAADAVCNYMSTAIDRSTNNVLVQSYDVTTHLDGSVVGPPVDAGHVWTLGDSANTGQEPNEVAGILSFHGAGRFPEGPDAGPRPAERHRGRVYIGPLDRAATGSATGGARLTTAFMTALVTHATNGDLFTGNTKWAVWSRANAEMYEVVGGFVDSAFDTQRRRGNSAAVRSTWNL